MPDRGLMLFKNDHYFSLNLFGQVHSSPRKIVWDFSRVQTPIDASLNWNGFVFLFKGNTYWKYKSKVLVRTDTISQGFSGLPQGPFDDVFKWNVNHKIYFFKGSQYWKYDSKIGNVINGYPKSISQFWRGIPDSIDAAFSSGDQNQTYFFKDNKYYRFDDINKRLADDVNPPYPRQTVIWFLRCRNNANNSKLWKRPVPPELPITTTTLKPSSSAKPVTVIIDEDIEYYENDSWVVLLAVILAILFECIFVTMVCGALMTFQWPQHQQLDQQISQQRDQRLSLQAIEMQSLDGLTGSQELVQQGSSPYSNEASVS